ncbi:MAG: aldolase/citrate lyase family protein [Pseudomonadota bacterium]
MTPDGLRARILRAEPLVGTFVKTPAYEIIEVLAMSGLDFVCIDAEHAPQDRRGMDGCLAMAKALGLPALVRVPEGTPAQILMALDSGAIGVVVPHVDSVAKAQAIAKSAHFGHGGRGFAGSTRWAGQGSKTMPEVLAMDDETIVLAQIEEPEGVDAAGGIAATEGIDGLFVGPADMAVCLGKTDAADPAVREAMRTVGTAAKTNGKAGVTFVPSLDSVPAIRDLGISMFFVGSEHSFMLGAAREVATGFKA